LSPLTVVLASGEDLLPVWAQWIIGAAALAIACGVLWSKVFKPMVKFAADAEEMLPLLRELTATFRDTPHAFAVLDEIITEFRSDSGSTLKDALNRLEAAAEDNARIAQANTAQAQLLAVGVEAAKQLAERDRQEVQRLFIMLDRLTTQTNRNFEGIAGIQAAAGHVADDLAASHQRATDVGQDALPGEAADAASQTPPELPPIT